MSVSSLKVELNNDDNEIEDVTGYIVAVSLLCVIIVGILIGGISFWYFRLRPTNNWIEFGSQSSMGSNLPRSSENNKCIDDISQKSSKLSSNIDVESVQSAQNDEISRRKSNNVTFKPTIERYDIPVDTKIENQTFL